VAPEKCGEIFERLGRLNEASQTYLAVAEMHLTRRDVEKAIDNWGRATRLTPDNLNAHSRLARALEHTNRTHEAVLEYLEVARLFQRAKDVEKATQAATYAQQLGPHSPQARDALDKLRRGQSIPVMGRAGTGPLTKHTTGMLRPAEAREVALAFEPEPDTSEAMRRASPLAAGQEVALARLAEMLFEEDTDTSKTASTMGAITRGTGPLRGSPAKRAQAIMYLGQAINNQTNGDREAAISNYETALEAGLDHPSLHFALGALYLDLNKPNDAVQHFKQATAYEKLSVGAYFGLGQSYSRTNKIREALGSLLEALKSLDMQLAQDQPNKQNALAETYESLSDAMLRASEAEMAKVVQGLLKFLSGEGWEERARQVRQQLDKSAEDGQVTPLAGALATPNADRVLESMRQIEAYMAKQFWGTAMEEAYRALEYSPTHLPVHLRMAEILLAENKPQVAIAKYAVIANSYRIRGDMARAAKVMQEVLRLSPLDVNVRSELIAMLTEQGKTEDALAQYLDLADTYYQLTDLDSAHSTFEKALRVAQRSTASRSWSVQILHRIGDIDLQRLAWREALRSYEQIKTLAPDDEKGRVTLISLHFHMGNPKQALAEVDSYLKQLLNSGRGDKAIEATEALIRDQPEETGLVARLARVYQEQGRKAEAIEQYDRLGEMQLNAGDNAQAVETIRTIIALGPEDPSGYQQLLAQLQGQD
ncbi:MAG: tetratricopeptide repeat protein, partial [Anaerolineales bacterium]